MTAADRTNSNDAELLAGSGLGPNATEASGRALGLTEPPATPGAHDPILDAAWDAHCLALERRQGLALSSAMIVLIPLATWAVDQFLQVGRAIPSWTVVCLVTVLLASVFAFKRASSLAHVRGASAIVQLACVVLVCSIAPLAPRYGFGVLMASLLVWGPHATFAWPPRLSMVLFGAVPVAFLAAHLVDPRTHPVDELAASVVYLAISAVVCTALSVNKTRTQREGFEAAHRLATANAELETSMRRLVKAQAQLVESEKLAALGHLVAGVAHELNSPLGAIDASAGNLERLVRTTAIRLVPLLARFDVDQRDAFQAFVVNGVSAGGIPRSSKEIRAMRRQVEQALGERNVADADRLAELFADLGIADVAPYAPLLAGVDPVERIQPAFDLVTLCRSAENIQTAAGRASKMVFALKRFAHPGNAEAEPTEAAVTESLDTVLTLYQGQTKHSVDVERIYESPGIVRAHHDQLSQVWTNLVHNALQAMANAGSLTVTVRERDDQVQISVTDSGPGISREVQARMYEPFFTTKAAGEGTGLGLSICRDIVKHHGGSLAFETEPGRTTFTVTLPSAAASRPTPDASAT